MNASGSRGSNPFGRLTRIRMRRGVLFGVIIISALLAFEIFNYSTTEYALADLLGGLTFAGIRWATILSLAFCGIDFAGIARLFTPEQGNNEPTEIWYLFGAWMLAATMNAILTWWGVSMAVVNHPVHSSSVIDASALVKVVPVFVAIMVWLIRILIIGSLSYAGDRLFSQADRPRTPAYSGSRVLGGASALSPSSLSGSSAMPRPAPKPVTRPEPVFARPEPTYHSLTMGARSAAHPSRPTADAHTNSRR